MMKSKSLLNIFFHLIFTVLFAFTLSITGIAQGIVTGTTSNPVLKTVNKNKPVAKNLLKATNASIPFFDDFSNAYNPDYYPLSAFWADSNVFINHTFESYPISTGVATFDGFDKNGDLYTQDTLYSPFTADTLTSQPIDLSGITQALLTFYYQPQGLGDKPEKYDSLIVQFYSPVDLTWTKIDTLSFAGSALKPFTRASAEITESKYLQNGFRFRFMNIITYDTIMGKIKVGNCDNWNIDYVTLNANQDTADTAILDITYRTNIFPLYKTYVTVPWHHYEYSAVDFVDTMKTYLTNYNEERHTIYFWYYYKDSIEGYTSGNVTDWQVEYNLPEHFNNILIDKEGDGNRTNNNLQLVTSQSTMEDTAIFIISCEFEDSIWNPGWDRLENNRVVRIQEFRDYYAYDDGSAEKGWSFRPGKYVGWLATKFKSYQTDSLYSISLYFNSILPQDDQGRFFDLVCYSVDQTTGLPADLLYEQAVEVPAGFYGFRRFWLDTPQYVEDEIYIGIHQENPKNLNLGFDCNDSVVSKYYAMSDYPNWEPFGNDGVIMIRAGFYPQGLLPTGIKDFNNSSHSLQVFPNPASDVVYLKSDDNQGMLQNSKVEIIDPMGRILYSQKYSDTGIRVSQLPEGMYIIRVSSSGYLPSANKFIIAR